MTDGVGESVLDAVAEAMRDVAARPHSGWNRHPDPVNSGAGVLVVVNGVPGSGKSSLARELASATGLPHLSKDALKEYLATTFPREPSPSQLSTLAGEVLWDLVSAMPSGAIVETWFGPTGRAAVERGCRRAGIDPDRVTEIWCEVPLDVARARFRARMDTPDRPSRLDTLGRDEAYWRDLADAQPLGLARLVRVSTEHPLDAATIAGLAREVVRGHPS